MKQIALRSDQLYNWSDYGKEEILLFSTAKTRSAPAPAPSLALYPPWLLNRTLQTLREARLQMRSGSGPWPEVLPFGQSIGRSARDGLRPAPVPEAGRSVPGQLPPRPENLGRGVPDQSRALTPQRKTLKKQVCLERFPGGLCTRSILVRQVFSWPTCCRNWSRRIRPRQI